MAEKLVKKENKKSISFHFTPKKERHHRFTTIFGKDINNILFSQRLTPTKDRHRLLTFTYEKEQPNTSASFVEMFIIFY